MADRIVITKDITTVQEFTSTDKSLGIKDGKLGKSILINDSIIPIDLNTPEPTKKGIFQPTEVGIYENFGNLEFTQSELESNIVYFYYLNGEFTKQSKGVLTVDYIDSESENAVNGIAVSGYTNQTVNTIADLRFFNGKEGQVITLLGYYEKGDKEPLNYKFTTAQGVDDGGFVINTETGSWLAIMYSKINVKDFGAKGDGVTDDTIAINKAFSLSGNIEITDGIYMANAVTRLKVRSNSIITFSKNAIIKAIPTTASSYTLLEIGGSIVGAVENVVIYNLNLIGERYEHLGTGGEHGHGCVIARGSKNIKIYNAICNNFWGDGLTIYGGEDVYIENLSCDYNRRQGTSITRGRNITLKNPRWTNTDGTAPMCGLDIEPNNTDDYIENIIIENPYTENNLGAGIIVGVTQLVGSNKDVQIKIINHKDYRSSTCFQVSHARYNADFKITGSIIYENGHSLESKVGSIFVENYAAYNTPVVRILNPTIINCNTTEEPLVYGSAVKVSRTVAQAGDDTHPIGNVIIENPIIIDNRSIPLMRSGVLTLDDVGIPFENLTLKNPLKIEGIIDLRSRILTNKGLRVIDELNYLKLTGSLSNVTGVFSYITNTGWTSLKTHTLNYNYIDMSVKVVNDSVHGIRLIPQTGFKFKPFNIPIDKYIQSYEVGASLIFKRLPDGNFIIESFTGKWEIQDGGILTSESNATTAVKGIVNRTPAIANITTTTVSSIEEANTRIKILEDKINDLLVAMRTAGMVTP